MKQEPAKPIDQIIHLINALADDIAQQERTLRALARAVEWYKDTTEPKTPQQHQEIMDALKELKQLQHNPYYPTEEMPLKIPGKPWGPLAPEPESPTKRLYHVPEGPSCDVSSQPAFHDPHNPDLVIEGQESGLSSISGTTLSVRSCNAVNTSPTEELYERLHEDHGA